MPYISDRPIERITIDPKTITSGTPGQSLSPNLKLDDHHIASQPTHPRRIDADTPLPLSRTKRLFVRHINQLTPDKRRGN